jgi:hypothetical protein
VRDISQQVRQLPLDEARQLLDAHFGPAWRKAFLGATAASSFPTAEVFFRPKLNATNSCRIANVWGKPWRRCWPPDKRDGRRRRTWLSRRGALILLSPCIAMVLAVAFGF